MAVQAAESSPTGANGESKSFGVSAEEWFTPARFAILLAILIVAFFPDVLFGGKSFVFRDFGIFTYPNAYYQRESFWRGELPLWNPLSSTGIPFLAQWNTACLYPLSLIYILLPLAWGLTVFLLAHLFLAGFGMYLLAVRWTGNRLAAAMAGLAFAFNGMTLNCLMWTSTTAALALMPWVVLLVERAWLSGRNRQLVIAALAGAAQILTGTPEIIVFTWLVLAALWIGQMVCNKTARGGIFIRAILVGVIAALLSAAQLLPFLDLLAHSERTTSYATGVWSIPLWGWANLFVPLFHCYRAPLGVYFQPGQDWTSSYYPGIGVLALAALAVIFQRAWRVWLLAAFAIFGFLIALGDHGGLYPLLLKFFPPLGFMRYPVKFVFLSNFSLPLLAALAVAQLCSGGTDLRKQTTTILMIFISTVSAILWYAHLHPLPYEHWPLLFENGAVRVLFLLLILGVLTYYGKIQNSRRQIIAALLVLISVWLDAVSHAPRQNPAVQSSVFQSGLLTQRMNPPPQPGESRALMTKQSHDLFYGSMLTNADNDYIGRRCALLGNCNILDNIPMADGFYPLYIREQRTLFMWLFSSPTNAFPNGLADFLGISQISDPVKILTWQYRPSCLPFYSIGAKPEFVELSNTPAFLLAKDFDSRKTVYLPLEAKAQLQNIEEAHGEIHPSHFSGQRVELEVKTDSTAVLVLSQTYHHSWKAYVDDKSTPLFQANYAFQALEVPAGSHHVKLAYEDRQFYVGSVISLMTLAGCLILLLFERRKRPLA